jgi:hypothetical protein
MFVMRWHRVCLGRMLLPMAGLCASTVPGAALDLVAHFEQQRAEPITG